MLADARTADLLGRLSPWETEIPLSGHERLEFAPNLLGLLADMGVTAQDDARIDAVLASMLEHQDEDGRFQALGRWRNARRAGLGRAAVRLPCDRRDARPRGLRR